MPRAPSEFSNLELVVARTRITERACSSVTTSFDLGATFSNTLRRIARGPCYTCDFPQHYAIPY